jgi:hypothetical protein
VSLLDLISGTVKRETHVYLLNHAISQRRAFAPALTLRRAILNLTLHGTTLAGEKICLSATTGDIEGAGALGAEELLGSIGSGEHLYTIDIIF